jgi:hypothetical protein
VVILILKESSKTNLKHGENGFGCERYRKGNLKLFSLPNQ